MPEAPKMPSSSAVQAGAIDDSALAMPRINAEPMAGEDDLLREDENVTNEPAVPTEPPSAGLDLGISDDAPMAPAAQAPVEKPARRPQRRSVANAVSAKAETRSVAKAEPVQSGNNEPILQTSMQTQINVGVLFRPVL